MMEIDEVLELLTDVLSPKQLNEIEKIVFQRCWLGQSYQEIAESLGYSADYVKGVGSQLWILLSKSLDTKITKKNIRLIPSLLQSRSNKSNGEVPYFQKSDAIEFPSGPVPLHSNLYVDRPPLEQIVRTEILKPGSLIRIRAAQQMGKTSLLLRLLNFAQTRGLETVLINLQQADSSLLSNLDQFLRWFCYNVSRQLNLFPRLDGYWNEESGSKVSCSLYFQEYLLKHASKPIVLALDEVDSLFEYSEIVQDFLPLLRSWHEDAARLETWRNLRLVVVHSTESNVPLQQSLSPFNVGLPIQLMPFSRQQVLDLIQRHGLDLDAIQTDLWQELLSLIDGHPYLVRLTLYWLSQGMSLEQILRDAATPAGIYGEHLHQQLEGVQIYPGLWDAFRRVVSASEAVQLNPVMSYQLESLGLIKRNGNEVFTSRRLYELFFKPQFEQMHLE